VDAGHRDVPVVAIVGRSGSGKTTLLERLIPVLRRRGRKVAVAKHSHHAFDLDPSGKDSRRLAEAGADVVAFSSPEQLVVMQRASAAITLDEVIARHLGKVDIVLVEGYRELPIPKIEVLADGAAPLCSRDTLLGVVGMDSPGLPVPRFDPADVEGLAEFLDRVLSVRRA
jgi:molybdopterin-guanine dinucleotide biosynthesis protein B